MLHASLVNGRICFKISLYKVSLCCFYPVLKLHVFSLKWDKLWWMLHRAFLRQARICVRVLPRKQLPTKQTNKSKHSFYILKSWFSGSSTFIVFKAWPCFKWFLCLSLNLPFLLYLNDCLQDGQWCHDRKFSPAIWPLTPTQICPSDPPSRVKG